ncbi:MAG: hypothetical protein RBR20_03925 [Desulfobacterales bacterium]|jgi:hypothetical protein|nr:hypothetical protein [Desulfobacterales bacterium]
MRVLLISANTETLNLPTMAMGLGAVAAATRAAGHSVRFLDLMGKSDVEGLIAPADDLLQPRFYVDPPLADWLHETAAEWCACRPGWFY